MGQRNPEGLKKQWAKPVFCGQCTRLSSIFQFLATCIFKACLETYIWPLSLRLFTNSQDQDKRIWGKKWPFSNSESRQKERIEFSDNNTAPAF